MNITSSGELEKKSLKELADIYNANLPKGSKKIKTFKDKPTAVKRVIGALGAASGKKGKAASVSATKGPKSGRPSAADVEVAGKSGRGGRERGPFNFKPKKKIKTHRVNDTSKRNMSIVLLKRKNGASFEEIMEKTGWNRRNSYEGVSLLHRSLGYGLIEDAKGRIRLIGEPE